MNGDSHEVWKVLREMDDKLGGLQTDVAVIKQRLDGMPCSVHAEGLKALEAWQTEQKVAGRPPSRAIQIAAVVVAQVVTAGAVLLAAVKILAAKGAG